MKIVLGEEETGNTLVEFECVGDCLISREMLSPINNQLYALKCDLEIIAEDGRQSVRFTVPTRLLQDELHWI
ncbi:hypothetical protein D3C71_2175290 [compost metagenome]